MRAVSKIKIIVTSLLLMLSCSNNGGTAVDIVPPANNKARGDELIVGKPQFEAEFTTLSQTQLQNFYGSYEVVEVNDAPVIPADLNSDQYGCSNLAYIGNSRIKSKVTVLGADGSLSTVTTERAGQPIDPNSSFGLVADEMTVSILTHLEGHPNVPVCHFDSILFLKDQGNWLVAPTSLEYSFNGKLTLKEDNGSLEEENINYRLIFESQADGTVRVGINQSNLPEVHSLRLKKK